MKTEKKGKQKAAKAKTKFSMALMLSLIHI